jgi:REP element-mobilizing transposase RayT
MVRPLRIEIPGGFYHIMSRGNAKAPVFINDADRTKFIDILAKTVHDYGWLCHTYCLMGNHYHLLIETPEANLSAGMHLLNGMYTQAFNSRHQRTGHVFEGRFRSNLVEKGSYLLELTRYIVLNPVRAGLTESPEEYRWSSYNATCGNLTPPGFLHTTWILEQFGSSSSRSISAYINFVNDKSAISRVDMESPSQIIGSEVFVETMTTQAQQALPATGYPGPKKMIDRMGLDELFGTRPLTKTERNLRVIRAFQEFGYSKTEIAAATGMHLSSIGRIIR